MSIQKNPNSLLDTLENWLLGDPKLSRVSHRTMNTYKSKRDKRGVVWVWKNGLGTIQLRHGNYSTVDTLSKVKYNNSNTGKPLWGGYPQFTLVDTMDINYATRLIGFAKNLK